jgi:hypothetical protein
MLKESNYLMQLLHYCILLFISYSVRRVVRFRVPSEGGASSTTISSFSTATASGFSATGFSFLIGAVFEALATLGFAYVS